MSLNPDFKHVQKLSFISVTHNAIGHEVMPLQLAATVFMPVELFHLRDVVLKLHGESDGYPVTAPCPRSRIQDLDVDGVCRVKFEGHSYEQWYTKMINLTIKLHAKVSYFVNINST